MMGSRRRIVGVALSEEQIARLDRVTAARGGNRSDTIREAAERGLAALEELFEREKDKPLR